MAHLEECSSAKQDSTGRNPDWNTGQGGPCLGAVWGLMLSCWCCVRHLKGMDRSTEPTTLFKTIMDVDPFNVAQ